jgi:CheY-like chemotaxis protein
LPVTTTREEKPAPREADERPFTPLRILLVEDNLEVGQFAAGMLEEMGHTVTRVGDAQAALEALEVGADRFDLVFSDVVMPGASGVELGRTVRTRWPSLAVILTSGYSHVLAEEAGHGFPLLRKPYTLDSLIDILRNAGR